MKAQLGEEFLVIEGFEDQRLFKHIFQTRPYDKLKPYVDDELSLFMLAVLFGRRNIVRRLLEQQRDLDLNCCSAKGFSLQHLGYGDFEKQLPTTLASEMKTEVDSSYRDLQVQIRDVERDICREFDTPAPNFRKLRTLAERGQGILRQWLRLELKAIADSIVQLRGSHLANLDEIGPKPQAIRNQTSVGLLTGGQLAQGCFEEAVEKLRKRANLVPSDVKIGPVKTAQRLAEKMSELERSGKHPCAVFDVNRATILFVAKDILQVVVAISLNFATVWKMKNKFDVDWDFISEPPCLLYQLSLREPFEWMETGQQWIVELQLTTHEIMSIKDHSHVIYELLRVEKVPSHCVVCRRAVPV